MKAIIKVNTRVIEIIYCNSFVIEEILNNRVYKFLDKEKKMIANILLDDYDKSVEVIIDNE